MKKMTASVAASVALALGLVATGPVMAQGSMESPSSEGSSSSPSASPGASGSASPSASFQTLDANADGYISKDEAKNNSDLSQAFDQVDADGNSRLDEGEFAQFEVTEQQDMAPGSSTPSQ